MDFLSLIAHNAPFLGAIAVGVVLGLLGGGGSILTIPLLVYGFRLPPVVATGYSLFIVGVAASFGTIGYMRRGWMSYRIALLFVAPSALVVHVTRHYVLPALPDTLSLPSPSLHGAAGLLALGGATLFAVWLTRGNDSRLVAARRALALAVPAMIAVTFVRGWLIPQIPARAVHGAFTFSRDHAIMWLLAAVLLVSGLGMLRNPESAAKKAAPKPAVPLRFPIVKLGALGVCVGALTGVLGAGGGFLVTPALILLAGLPFRVAVGTSLLIMAVNSLAGFTGELEHARPDWTLLLTLTAFALAGVAAGSAFSARIPSATLRRALGFLLTAVSAFITVAELWALRS